ncbi:acyltransferase family protein [Streptococcus cuniculi]|uniref:Acyltransferase 3 domain-containing protein n=1 Tax=Streptococcus cuniculi TaxID=1432788 RepID=A0A4Y9JB78_9STRE|nr:acyltransferase family protein [Streptococcus cuniculi]MBF0778899.1 acyltransferase family protein [Streptococcus cuniculi]TFU97174.1 hypothetical protein E4T82_09235 [Streptococcus cuniculi]
MEKAQNRLVRQSNIELLRIVAMLGIIASHFSVFGHFDFPINTISMNRLWIQFLPLAGNIGVNIFVLISGYFLIHKTTLEWRKVLAIWLQLSTYSLPFFLLGIAIGPAKFDVHWAFTYIVPILYRKWWFISCYIVLLILSPYIN